jgi:hypothetical protein
MSPPVRVIIDVGAQVLEWRNEEVAREWLARAPGSQVQAAVFFDDRDELMVIDRKGSVESFDDVAIFKSARPVRSIFRRSPHAWHGSQTTNEFPRRRDSRSWTHEAPSRARYVHNFLTFFG